MWNLRKTKLIKTESEMVVIRSRGTGGTGIGEMLFKNTNLQLLDKQIVEI